MNARVIPTTRVGSDLGPTYEWGQIHLTDPTPI